MVTLDRGMGLLQATATNIIGMVGVGPFLTIPFMVTAMHGPHIIYAWAFGAVLALCDGLVYAELGAALPGSGGPYVYLREAYRPFGLGRLMAFIFIFQLMLVAPLSVAGGAVGFADYLGFYWTTMTPLAHNLVAAGVCVAVTALLYRDITSIGRLAVVMLAVVLMTVGWVIVAGLFSFSWAQAFDFPPEARRLDARAAARDRRRRPAGDVQLRRLQQRLQHRRGAADAGADAAALDRAVDRHRRRALRGDEHGDPRHGAVAGGAAVADDRVAVHRADVRRSGARPHRGARDDVADSVRHRLVALRGDPRLLADPVRRGARRPVLRRLRPPACRPSTSRTSRC